MTLYLWMHWFWITFYMSGKCAPTTPLIPIQLTVLSAIHCSQSTPMTASTSSQLVNESSIPPAVNRTSDHSTEKPCKFILKKHTVKNITVPQPTVIEQNITIPVTDNDTISTTNHSYFENNTISEFDYVDEVDGPHNKLSAAGITGITVGCMGIIGIICAVSFVVYRNRGFNRPQVLNDRCSNPDSSGYIDDASIRVPSLARYKSSGNYL